MGKNLSLTTALQIAINAPCSAQVRKIIVTEVDSGNFIKSFNQVSIDNDECYYILLFGNDNIKVYPNMRTMHKKDKSAYKTFVLVDRSGCTEIRFNY